MKRTFFTGLAILLPITITFFLLKFLVDFLTTPFLGAVEDFFNTFGEGFIDPQKHRLLLEWISRILIILIIIGFIFLLGLIGEKFFFKIIVKKAQRFLLRIPIVKNIFRVTQEITAIFFGEKREKLFKKTVLISFPHMRAKAIGLVTSIFPKKVYEKELAKESEDLYSVFVPTAPHPISGFLILTKEAEMQTVDVSTESVFKFLVSCGAYEFQSTDENPQSDLLRGQNSSGEDSKTNPNH